MRNKNYNSVTDKELAAAMKGAASLLRDYAIERWTMHPDTATTIAEFLEEAVSRWPETKDAE